MTTKRTNERKPIQVTVRGEIAVRMRAMFINKGRYSLKEIYNTFNNSIYPPESTRASIRSVLHRWQKKRLLLTDGHSYILNPNGGKEILLTALNSKEPVREQEALEQVSSDCEPRTEEKVILEITKKWWDTVLDLPQAWEEQGKIYCRIQEHIALKMWALCERKPRPRRGTRGDPSQKATHKQKSYTLIAFPKGKFHVLTKKDPRWLDDLGKWLLDGGMTQSDIYLVSQAIHIEYGESIGTVEVAIVQKLECVDKYELNIEQGRLSASLKVVHSHYPEGEIEATGPKMFRDNWLASLTGSTLAVMALMEDQDVLKDKLLMLETKFEKFVERMDAEEREEMKEQMQELREKLGILDGLIENTREDQKTPDYIM